MPQAYPWADADASGGRTVQIKASGVGKGPAFTPGEGRAVHLLFLIIDFDKAAAYVRYKAPETPARAELKPGFAGTKRILLLKTAARDAGVAHGQRLIRARRVGTCLHPVFFEGTAPAIGVAC